jgi:hypothetical protein
MMWSEPVKVPVLPALVQVIADTSSWSLVQRLHDAQRLAGLRPQPGFHGGTVSRSNDQHRLFWPGWNKVTATAAPVSARSPRS